MKWSLGKYSKEGCQRPRNFANVVCGAPRGLSESGQVRMDFAVARALAVLLWLVRDVAEKLEAAASSDAHSGEARSEKRR